MRALRAPFYFPFVPPKIFSIFLENWMGWDSRVFDGVLADGF